MEAFIARFEAAPNEANLAVHADKINAAQMAMMIRDDSMARGEAIAAYAGKYQLECIGIEDSVRYRTLRH